VEKSVGDEFGNAIKISDGNSLKYQLGYPIVRLKIEPSLPRISYHHVDLLGVLMGGI